MEEEPREARIPSDAEGRGGTDGSNGGALDSLVEAWWSRYCPSCQSRHLLSETTCANDGCELRDRSVSFIGNEETCLPDTTMAPVRESLAAAAGGGPLREPPAEDRALPEILGAKWRLGERRGGGTFGSFFIGSHHILGMKVGIKVLRRRLNSASTWRRLFHQEALRVSCLNHPNIVKVFDYGEEEGRPYLVMEFLTGKSLNSFIGGQELDLEDRVEIVRQIAIALGAAHEGQGIGEPLIHLDLKPEHIFVEKIRGKWHVKVIDFGIAEIASAPNTDRPDGTEERRVAGTLPYMAPERWSYVVDPRCDIYSLGIILYELVAGRKPFQAANPKAMRQLHETVRPTPPSTHRTGPRTPALQELDGLILRCLEKDPARRPQTAQELVEGIELWQARPRLTRGQRLRRAVALPALTLLLVLLGLYWAPWESVRVPKDSGMILGPEQALSLEPIVLGLGYEDYQASLLVAGGEDGKEIPIELERPDRSQFQFRVCWKQFRGLAPLGSTERLVKARLRATGILRRSVTTEPFDITLDNQCPKIPDPSGTLEIIDRKSLWMLGTEFTVTALERLKEEGCTLNDARGIASTDRKTVTFKVPPGESRILLRLTDAAGNRDQREWSEVRWLSPPRLISERTLFTKDPEYLLTLQIAGDCEQATANDVKLERIALPFQGVSTYQKIVKFSGENRISARRNVKVLLWSSFSLKKGRERDQEENISIEYCPRALQIQSFPQDPLVIPEGFTVLDSNGAKIPIDELVSLDPEIYILEGPRKLRRADTPLKLDATGKLGVSGINELRGAGPLILMVRARDRYGNQAVWQEVFHDYAAPPKIVEFGLASFDGPGSEGRKLLHPDCPLRENNPSGLSLHVQVQSSFPIGCDLRVGSPDAPPERCVPIESLGADGLCVFDEMKLLRLLSTGPNEVFLVAASKESSSLRDWSRLVVHCTEPLDLDEVLPKSDQALRADRAHIEVGTRRGPKITRLTAKVGGNPIPGVVTTEGRHAVDVPVALCGATTLVYEMEFEGGWKLDRSLRYRREPAPGYIYTFSAGESAGEVELEHYRDEPSGSSSWFTTREGWESLSRRFPKSQSGQRWSRLKHSQDGVSLDEALEIARWLTNEARSAGLLGSGEEFALPRFEQLVAIEDRIEPGEELWLCRVPRELRDEGEKFDAAFAAKGSNGEFHPLRALPRENRAFRLVVIERGKSKLHPASALGARTAVQRGKP